MPHEGASRRLVPVVAGLVSPNRDTLLNVESLLLSQHNLSRPRQDTGESPPKAVATTQLLLNPSFFGL